jgi:endonuclease YncB( thermonuclease family)
MRFHRSAALCAVALAQFLAVVMPAAATEHVGMARVVDGDTLVLDGKRVRLGGGVDAPEGSQVCERQGRPWRCGDAAREALRRLTAGQVVRCVEEGRDRYQRILGDCWAGSVNLNREMVRLGWALDYRRYSRGRYAAEQAEAQAAARGLWASRFVPPWEWRRQTG